MSTGTSAKGGAPRHHEWTEVAEDWVTGDVIEVRFRTDGTHVWVWSPAGDGLEPDPEHNWAPVAPPPHQKIAPKGSTSA